MVSHNIPKATAKRLPLYYRYLNILADSGKARVSSNELAEGVKVDSATIRRDFSYFGALGKRGYGYDVVNLLNFFKKTLNQDELTTVALVGVGNLGHALLHFNFQKTNNIRIGVAFDVDEKLVNTIEDKIPIYHMDNMKEQLSLQQIEIAILAVPADAAQAVADDLVDVGVKGILNFTPVRISVPDEVLVQNVDLANELQTLIYFLNQFGNK